MSFLIRTSESTVQSVWILLVSIEAFPHLPLFWPSVTAPFPIAIWLLDVAAQSVLTPTHVLVLPAVIAFPALSPITVFQEPVIIFPASLPTAVLLSPQLAPKASYPTAVLLSPSSVASKAWYPTAVFAAPVVSAVNAEWPIAIVPVENLLQ